MRDATPKASEARGHGTTGGWPRTTGRLALGWASVAVSWLIILAVTTALAASVIFEGEMTGIHAFVEAPPAIDDNAAGHELTSCDSNQTADCLKASSDEAPPSSGL